MQRPFCQIDVFTSTAYRGNPVAVVLDADGLTTEEMQRFAHWTNLSETTFVLDATDPAADYRLRIFTTDRELPFAGHPTLGTCHAWLEHGGAPSGTDTIVQECGAGLVSIRRSDGSLAFAAPPLIRSGPLDSALMDRVTEMLRLDPSQIVDAAWADNGPGWVAVRLGSVDEVLAVRPGYDDLAVGIVAPYPPGSPEAFEVRAFYAAGGSIAEDPVTGSLNASLAQWMLATGAATAPYIARQGTVLGRAGRVQVSSEPDGTIWIGGGTVTCISGEVAL